MKKQTQYLNILLAAMIVWVPNQLHLPADLGVKGLNSINPVSHPHLRTPETSSYLVYRLLPHKQNTA